ncbi:MAG: MaoC family dehydratase [Burkholderiales bacterium]|nr:MaoC family dehydratase [Burkholderiales bacterium]
MSLPSSGQALNGPDQATFVDLSMNMYSGRCFNELSLGSEFETSMTLTEAHIVMGAGLFCDFNPLHVDEAFAAKSRFGGRIAHGYLTSNAMAAPLGMLFHGTAIAYVEHHIRFTHPVRAGDTLAVKWTVAALDAKPKIEGGLVTLRGVCVNQDGIEVANAEAKMLVHNATA